MRWQSGIGNKGANKTFSNFIVSSGKETAFREAKFWNPEKESLGLLFYGPTGTGKSHLSYAIANKLLELGIFTKFLSTVDIPRENSEEISKLTDPDEYPILILDDIGAEKYTDRALECLNKIIDGRLRNGGHIICTTNYQPKELKKKLNTAGNGYGERIVGRLKEACLFIALGGEDHRNV